MIQDMKVVAIVGMAGAGKSVVSRVFEANGYVRVRFGDITDQEIRKRNQVINETNERQIRELLRKEHGMAAYAILNRPRIDESLKNSDAVLDGLYSWEEYLYFKECYGKDFYVVAVWASPKTRYARLAARKERSLSLQEAANRDKTEIENLNKGGPIACADFTLTNEISLEDIKSQAQSIVNRLKVE